MKICFWYKIIVRITIHIMCSSGAPCANPLCLCLSVAFLCFSFFFEKTYIVFCLLNHTCKRLWLLRLRLLSCCTIYSYAFCHSSNFIFMLSSSSFYAKSRQPMICLFYFLTDFSFRLRLLASLRTKDGLNSYIQTQSLTHTHTHEFKDKFRNRKSVRKAISRGYEVEK